MAPLAPSPDLSLSSLELDLASTPFSNSAPSTSKRSATLPFSPLADHYLLSRDMATPAAPPARTSKPGAGTFDPHSINNKGFFALFALLGMAMVLAAIWFFFWAKNGGFVFRKGDWEEYKSTVLRRKGPNGTTLSGATKTTALGGGSIVADASRYDDEYGYEDGEEGTIDWDEKAAAPSNRDRGAAKKKKKGKKAGAAAAAAAPRGSKNNNDSDMRAYRHEKPAKVGGLNKEADGSYHHDFAASATIITDDHRSESTNPPRRHQRTSSNNPFRPNNNTAKKNPPTTPQHHQKRRENFYQHSPASGSSQRPLRPNGPDSGASTPTTTRSSRQASPSKQQQSRNSRASMPGSWTDLGTAAGGSRYSGGGGGGGGASEAGFTEDSRGTKAYFHPIPGLGGGGGGGYGGFRRGRGRRDSLSDSDEGESMMS